MKKKKTEATPKAKKGRPKKGGKVIEPEVADEDDDEDMEQSGELSVDPSAIEVLPAEPQEDESSRSREIVRYDPLTSYLREISRYHPLSRSEEREVAFRYYKNKDIEAARTLVVSNLWLVVKIAREYEAAARNILDLIQEGNIGLMEAVKNFDPFKDVRFPSYAVWWIRAYIIRYVIANWRLVKLGTTQAQRKLFFNLKKEKDKLEREGFAPMPKLLAEKLNVKESEVIEMEQRLGGSSEVSVDAPLPSGDGETSLLSLLPNQDQSPEEIISRQQLEEQLRDGLKEFAATLNEKERAIFQERMLGDDKATLQDMAAQFALSKERIRQIENRLRERLKEFLLQKLGPDIATFDADA